MPSPLHLIVDCATGETRRVKLTPDETAQRQVDRAAAKALTDAEAAREAQRQADVETLRQAAQTDPVAAAYARLAGIDLGTGAGRATPSDPPRSRGGRAS